jgi:hypothetical protein
MKRVNTSFKEMFTLFMTGYNYIKRSVHSLHGWLQFPSKKGPLSSWLVTIPLKEVFIVTSHEESRHFF